MNKNALKANSLYVNGFQPPFPTWAAYKSEIEWGTPSVAGKLLGNLKKKVAEVKPLVRKEDLGTETKKGSGLFDPQIKDQNSKRGVGLWNLSKPI